MKREKQHLAPKSYAKAVEQDLHLKDQPLGDSTITNGAPESVNGAKDLKDHGKKQTAAVLRITDTGAGAGAKLTEETEQKKARPDLDRPASQHERSAQVRFVGDDRQKVWC